jgi:hypothetical protein
MGINPFLGRFIYIKLYIVLGEKQKMKDIIKGVIEFVVGIAMLPTAGAFVVYVSNDANLSSIMGFALIMTLGLIIVAFGIIYHAVKTFFTK